MYETYKYACGQYPEVFSMMNYSRSHRKITHIFETSVYSTGSWCYPPILAADAYDRAREKMSKAKCQARYGSKCQILGRGKVYCKHCGHMLTGVGGTVKAYNCSYKDGNHNVTISVDIVDRLIWEEVNVLANTNASISNTTKITETEHEIVDKKNLRDSYKRQLSEIEEKENKLLDLYLNNKIKREIYDSKSLNIEHEKTKVEKTINTLSNEITTLEVILEDTQKDILNHKTMNYDSIDSFEVRQSLVRKYIDKVLIEKIKPRIYMIEFTYNTGIYIVQRGVYRYEAKNQNKRVYRLNEDGTEDLL